MPYSMMKQTMIALLFFLPLLLITLSEGATQDFHISFSSISHSSLLLQSYGSMPSLIAFQADSTSSVSAKLLFIPSSNTSYVLATYLSAAIGDDTGAILWLANRDHPVSGNFSLSLNQSSGNLVLLDGDGGIAWSSNNSIPPSGVGPVSMDLTTDLSSSIPIGTLFLSDASNSTLWQSSDYPTHTLVPSQFLEPSMRLVSWASSSVPSSGSYRLAMEASGLALYYNGSSQLPYWAWSYYGHNNSFGVTHTCRNLIRAYMDPLGGLQLQNTTATAPADSNNCTIDEQPITVHKLDFDDANTSTSSSEMTFLQLFSNGSLIANRFGSGRWITVFDLFGENKCLIPNYCGPYGVCTAPATCACPSSSDGSFPQIFPSNDRLQGCPPTRPLRCSSQSKLNLLTMRGVDYFASKYSSPLSGFSTMELCQDACLGDCFCLGAFWHSHSNSCYHASDMSGLQNTLNSSYMAFVKVERPPKSKHALVAGLSSGAAALLIILTMAGAFIYKNWRAASSQEAEDEDPFWRSVPGLPRRYSYKELEVITNGFSEQMGKGGFGVVYAGILQEAGTRVAVKRLESLRQGAKEFRSEVVILGGLHHYNLVGLIGFCAEGSHRLLIYEYMVHGVKL